MVATISADGLVKRYGEQAALDGFDLDVERGTVFGLLGPNGAGKTTAVRAFATLLRYDAGDAQVAGRDPVTEPHEVRRRIGLSGQTPAVDEILGGRQNLVLFGRLNRMSRREAQQRADELLGKFGLTDAADKQVKHYSGGMRRRLDLAVTLLLRPEVLFLDEPTTGLDPRNRTEVWEAVRSLAADGTTVLLTTQYLDEADQLAGRVAVMEAGRVIAQGTPDELKREVGGDQLEVVVEESADEAVDLAVVRDAVSRYSAGEPHVDREQRRVSAAVDDRVRSRRPGERRGEPMTTATTAAGDSLAYRPLERLRWAARDGFLVAGRDVAHWVREPQLIAWTLVFPIIFVVLFAYVLGSAMQVPGGLSYQEYVLPGMFVQTMAFGLGETLAAVQADNAKGVMDRFRSMPIAPSAVVVGRSLAGLLYSLVSLVILIGAGLLVGWRWHGTGWETLGAIGLLLLARMAFLWLGIYLGLRAKSPEMANGIYGLLYPVTMVSNAFAPPELMPTWLGVVASLNPLSWTTTAVRDLFGNPGGNPAGWLGEHSIGLAVLWPLVVTALTLPLAVKAYRGLGR